MSPTLASSTLLELLVFLPACQEFANQDFEYLQATGQIYYVVEKYPKTFTNMLSRTGQEPRDARDQRPGECSVVYHECLRTSIAPHIAASYCSLLVLTIAIVVLDILTPLIVSLHTMKI
ncbi:hypothetical protein B0H14DRAFT_3505026 [Mycena olivaceomarginata]|nr:hypothetical protein B0H14DRAFT_3505026 [Mycena olivaceomarginata]